MLAGTLLYRIMIIFADCATFVYEENFYHVVIIAAWVVLNLQNMIPM